MHKRPPLGTSTANELAQRRHILCEGFGDGLDTGILLPTIRVALTKRSSEWNLYT